MVYDSKEELTLTRKFLKDRLQRDNVSFYGHESEWENIYDLLKRTAEGESNSVLLIGPRGSGKSTLINSVLYSLLPNPEFYKNTIVVMLNGLIHTDDRLALKSITLQMNLENAVDGKVFGSFAENLSFLLACLKAGSKKSKSVIFILDEFDLFCGHHNQTLLYNLFDISQSAQAPICVFGITCRLDVIELFEKRVKSRFSHRQVFLFPNSDDFEGRLKLFRSLLRLPNEKEIKKLQPNLDHIQSTELCMIKNTFDSSKYKFSKKYADSWNKHIDGLASNDAVKSRFKSLYDFDVSDSFFKNILYKLVSHLDEEHPTITADYIVQITDEYELDNKVQLLCGLSVLEICIIIAIKHHSQIYDRDPFNFEIIFLRYSKFAKVSSTMQGVERAVVLKAFEHLQSLEFIIPLSNALKVQKEFQMHKLMLTYGQINNCISKYQALPTDVAQWYGSAI